MKLILTAIKVLLLFMAFMIERNETLNEEEGEEANIPSIMDFIKSAIKAPEFKALRVQEQLRVLKVLIMIHKILEMKYIARSKITASF